MIPILASGSRLNPYQTSFHWVIHAGRTVAAAERERLAPRSIPRPRFDSTPFGPSRLLRHSAVADVRPTVASTRRDWRDGSVSEASCRLSQRLHAACDRCFVDDGHLRSTRRRRDASEPRSSHAESTHRTTARAARASTLEFVATARVFGARYQRGQRAGHVHDSIRHVHGSQTRRRQNPDASGAAAWRSATHLRTQRGASRQGCFRALLGARGSAY